MSVCESVCVRERACVSESVCVCVRESECVCVRASESVCEENWLFKMQDKCHFKADFDKSKQQKEWNCSRTCLVINQGWLNIFCWSCVCLCVW